MHRVGDDRHFRREQARDTIERLECLAVLGRTNHDGTLGHLRHGVDLVQVECVRGLPEFVQHIVGGVHHIVDGPRANGCEALHEPLGARPHLHAANHDAHVAGGELRVFQVHDDAARVARATEALRLRDRNVAHTDIGQREYRTSQRGDLASHSEMREQVRAIGQDIDDQSRVANGQRVEERRAGRDVDVELHDAVVLFAKPEFPRRAEHAVGRLSADLALLDLDAVGQQRARGREGIELSRGNVWRAAHHVEQLAGAHVHLGDVQVVRVRMRCFLHHARHHDRRKVGAQRNDVFHGCRVRRDEVTQFRCRLRSAHECIQPRHGCVHSDTCVRKRMSES